VQCHSSRIGGAREELRKAVLVKLIIQPSEVLAVEKKSGSFTIYAEVPGISAKVRVLAVETKAVSRISASCK